MTIGATFKKADLHLHLPGTGQHYDCKERVNLNTDKEHQAFAERFVQRAREADLDIVAVTCHNDVSWVEPIRQAAQQLYGDALTVFPGVEIGTHSGQDGVHVLAIFETGTSQEDLKEFLLALGLRRNQCFDDTGEPRYTDLSLPQVLKKIEEYKGIAIAPHVFSDNGLLRSERQSIRIKDFTNDRLWAVDFKASIDDLDPIGRAVLENRDPNPDYRRKRPVACLNSSDARTLEEVGRWYTWIKCETVNLESLKQALLDPEARLRLRDDPPPEPLFQIRRVNVEETPSGFLRGLNLELNPRINCLIGGRGTGKSAIIELLRYVWEQGPVPERQDEIQAFLPVFFPESAEVSVDVRRRLSEDAQWTGYRLKRAGRSRTRVHQLSDDGTAVQRPDLTPQDIFTLTVFGQKEVLYTSKDIGTQLQMLDRMIGEPLESIEAKLNELDLRLRRNREHMVSLLIEISQIEEQTSHLGRIRVQLEQYRQAGLEELEQKRRLYEREAGLWETAENQIAHIESGMQSARDGLEMDLSYLGDEQLTMLLPNQELFVALREQLLELRDGVQEDVEKAQRRIQSTRRKLQADRDRWDRARAAFEEHYREQLRQIGGESFDLDTVLRLERERVNLERLQREAEAIAGQVKYEARERIALLEQREELTRKRYDLRARCAQRLTERLRPLSGEMPPRVRVRVIRSGNRVSLIEQLRRFLAGSRLWGSDYESIAECAAMDTRGFLACIEAADTVIDADLRIYGDWLPQQAATSNGQSSETHDSLQRLADFCGLNRDKARKLVDYLTQEQRLELDEYVVPDRVAIEVNIAREVEKSNKAGHKPIWRALGREIGEGVSVGQGCTAILSIILLETQYPLIIDQPEDDLDNRFIYDEIVQVLRRERGERQMLIATHNANIPVAGDAELIYALSVEETEQPGQEPTLRCKIEGGGFIDAPHMRRIVSETLEGGEEAFEIRKQKYGF